MTANDEQSRRCSRLPQHVYRVAAHDKLSNGKLRQLFVKRARDDSNGPDRTATYLAHQLGWMLVFGTGHKR